MTVIAFLLRVLLAAVVLRAAVLKLRDVAGFRQAVRNYGLLPPALVGTAAYGVLIAELLAAVSLVLGVELRVVGITLAVMLVVFGLAIAINLARGRTISCGCSGTAASEISWRRVIADCVLAGAAIVVAAWPAQPLSVLAGVADAHGSAAWTSRALAWLLVTGCMAGGGLLAAETLRTRLALRATRPDTAESEAS